MLLVSHAHIDHVAAVPYLTEKTAFKGRVFMTHPSKAVMRMLISDYLRILPLSAGAGDDSEGSRALYDERDLDRCARKSSLSTITRCGACARESTQYRRAAAHALFCLPSDAPSSRRATADMVRPQEIEHNGIKFWCYNAGHILGAAMFMIEIGGVKVLYTGDYSTEDDRHLMAAEHPSHSPDVLIVESTYGIQRHDRREDREQRFTSAVESIVSRGGKCLIPVFALGRAQELLLILDEYWAAHPHLHEQPIYFSSKLASRALRVYQTYINMMNHHIRQVMDYANRSTSSSCATSTAAAPTATCCSPTAAWSCLRAPACSRAARAASSSTRGATTSATA